MREIALLSDLIGKILSIYLNIYCSVLYILYTWWTTLGKRERERVVKQTDLMISFQICKQPI